jgi:nicotinamide mononucleotide transporter
MTTKYILESIGIAIVLTALSYGVGLGLGWITALNWLEVFAVFTSYSCTWLCTRQSRWNYPVGIVTTAAYSVLFYQWGMLALAIFNLYLVFSLIYGWFRWGPDGTTRPVTTIPFVWYTGYGALGLAILGLFLLANLMFNPAGISGLNPIDVGLAVASGVAQFMLDNKKIETWTVWAGINIVSIPFFLQSGLTLVAFQYVFFLINTFIARRAWRVSMPKAESLTDEQFRSKLHSNEFMRL